MPNIALRSEALRRPGGQELCEGVAGAPVVAAEEAALGALGPGIGGLQGSSGSPEREKDEKGDEI